MHTNILKSSLLIFIFLQPVFADDVGGLYEKILTKSEKSFAVKKLDFTVQTNFGARNIDQISGGTTDPFASVGLSVPIRSKSERISIEKSKLEFIEKASDLVRDVRTNRRKIEKLRDKSSRLETVLQDGGLEVINEYFKAHEDHDVLIEEIEANIRILKSMAE